MHKRIDHIVVRVKDLDASIQDYTAKLGMRVSKGPDDIPNLGMRRALLPMGDDGQFIELAEPLGEGGAIGRALERRGAQLIEAGSQVFVHPRDGHGVMYQLVERE
jgi:catechol 2,3-dioxygenase-like lactoylglutathione lyase family enzyme